MTDKTDLSKAEILKIPANRPELLFPPDLGEAKREQRRLSSRWHPDSGGDAEVMAHVNVLYKLVEPKLTRGAWDTGKTLRVADKNTGAITELDYLVAHDFELGKFYICNTVVGYLVPKAEADLVKNAVDMMGKLKYADEKMRREFARFLPELQALVVTDDDFLVIIKKSPKMILLRDVIDHFGGKLDPKHAAWVISRMYNLACYLRYTQVCHNGLSPGTVFIDPDDHMAAILGGWWYAVPRGAKLKALPTSTIMQISDALVDAKLGDHQIDAELVKYIGRAALGDPNGAKLKLDKNIPEAMRSWLQLPPKDKVYAQYATWRDVVLKQSFGKRVFVKLELSPTDVYK